MDELASQLNHNTLKRSKAGRIKKDYRKDKACPHEHCCKRYSSQIALNAHIKKVHRASEDPDEYIQ